MVVLDARTDVTEMDITNGIFLVARQMNRRAERTERKKG